MAQTVSPLRYPGGKSQFYKNLLKIIESNNLLNCIYVEPFCGGVGIGLKLLLENKVESIIINDLDRSIYAFWYTILNYTEEFCKKINETKITIEEYKLQKAIQKEKNKVNLFDLGFSTFFLNRTNRSGIISAGPIGGFLQNGKWKLDCRFNKNKLITKIKKIANFKEKILLFNLDTIELINNFAWDYQKKYFIFFDPPYYKKGKELYTNFYNHNDHLQLLSIIKIMLKSFAWIVTYDECNEILNLYKNINFIKISLNYSIEKKRKASEYLFYNNIIIPNL